MDVVVSGQDANSIQADAIVVPIGATLSAHRPLAAATLRACDPAVEASLGRLADVACLGLAPGTVLRLPAVGHPNVAMLLLLVVFDGRDGQLEDPDEERITHAARELGRALSTLGLGRVVVTNLAGHALDAGEVAATIVSALGALPLVPSSTIIFCDVDPATVHNMGAAIESLGVNVTRG